MIESAKKPIWRSILLENVRVTYINIYHSQPVRDKKGNILTDNQGASKNIYGVKILLDKEKNKKECKAILQVVKDIMLEATNTKMIGAYTTDDGYGKPFIDGDGPKGKFRQTGTTKPGYSGSMIVTAKSTKKPVIAGRDGNYLDEAQGKFYDGCYCNVQLSLKKTEGPDLDYVSSYIQSIQFWADGEPLEESAVNHSLLKRYDDDGNVVGEVKDTYKAPKGGATSPNAAAPISANDINIDDEDMPF